MQERKKGLIFDLHRGTTHDGPGMRTAVFFKGCPLSCDWCHNPEGISYGQEIRWTKKKCIGCLTCQEQCQFDAVIADENGIHIDTALCQKCGYCTRECPALALEMVGKYWDVDELVTEACKDDMFFEDFQGGITVTGGEPMMQYEFLVEFLKKIKERGYNTALDTSGFCLREALEKVYPYVDTFLYDIKLMDKSKHVEYTGVSNQLILNNLMWLIQKNQGSPSKKIWIRTPLIPGVTSQEENIEDIGRFLKGENLKGIERWELCAFNNVCKDKYQKIGKEWRYGGTPLMTEKEVGDCLRIAQRYVGGKAVVSGLTAK